MQISFVYFSLRTLRLLDSWTESRDLFNEEAVKLRAEFDAAKTLPAGS